MGVKLYNCLPNRLQTLNSVKIFKNDVKRILLENSLYTVQEFCNFFFFVILCIGFALQYWHIVKQEFCSWKES
jgi:hypothetical protein